MDPDNDPYSLIWIDDTALDYIYHGNVQTDDYQDKNEECMMLAAYSGPIKWHDAPCEIDFNYICKKGNVNPLMFAALNLS